MKQTLEELRRLEDAEKYAKVLTDCLRQDAPLGLELAAMAAIDPEMRAKLGAACSMYFGCLHGMHDAALIPYLHLASDIEARECFDYIYNWFTQNRLENDEPWPVQEDGEGERYALVSLALKALAKLQPEDAPWMSNYWLQIWYEDGLAVFHGEAFLGFILGDPATAATEMSLFMERELPERSDLLKQFHQNNRAQPYLLETLARARSINLLWAAEIALLLGLPD